MKYLILIMALAVFNCSDGSRFDGLVLVDENTGCKYLLKHNFADTYFVDIYEMTIIGSDTTYLFK